MAKKILLESHNSNEELTRELKNTRDGRYRLRVHAISLYQEGMRTTQIIKLLLINRVTFYQWIRRYNKDGLRGLKNVSLGGRGEGNPKWDDNIFTALFKKLDLMEEFYSVPKMQAWIKETYDVDIPQNTIHHRLYKAGYTFKSSRPNPYKGDPNLQASFKKMA